MPVSPRERCIAAATELIDALLDAIVGEHPDEPPVVITIPPSDPPPITPPPVIAPTGHPRVMLGTQGARLRAALATGTPPAAAWKASVARWLAGADMWGFAAWNGALLSALSTDVRPGAKAIAKIDAQVTAAEAQIAAGRVPEVAGDSYLQVGEMIGDLSLVYDWCFTQLTVTQRTRWIAYANQAVWNVWNPGAANWGGRLATWSGWSVNNPSNNYYYSFLRATMLLGLATLGENIQADGWLKKFRGKVVDQLVPTFERDLVGGGSREGTGYGTAMGGLFDLYAMWMWSTGENIGNLTKHTKDSLITFIQQITPTLDKIALTGDLARDSTAAFFDYHRKYLLALISLYPDAPEAPFAVSILGASSLPKMDQAFMQGYDFVYAPSVNAGGPELPLVRYASGIGQLYARTSWQKTATWMNLIAGPYTESHAHQDQGSICIYKGNWLALDAVMWSHSGVTDTGFDVGTPRAHSLVRVDAADGKTIGQRMNTTSTVVALHVGVGYVFAAVDLSPAYAGSQVTVMRRQVLWLQPDIFVIQDHVVSHPTTTQVWQLVVPTIPVISGMDASISIPGHSLRATRMTPGTWSARDLKLSPDKDFSGGYVLEQSQPGGDRTTVVSIAIDGASSPALSTVSFSSSGVGVQFILGGKPISLGVGIDTL